MSEPDGTKKATIERQLAFWDIESLINIFMFAVYLPESRLLNQPGQNKTHLVYFYLFDDIVLTDALKDIILKHIFKKNRKLDPNNTVVTFMDLSQEQANRFLLGWFGADDKSAFAGPEENRFRSICPRIHSDLDTDNGEFPYLLGYNTANYDNVMLAFYFHETWGFAPVTGEPSFIPTTAAIMRKFNNHLFTNFKSNMPQALSPDEKNIYENMLRTGMFIDVGKINDKVYKMPLKRIMGQLGMDIFEDGDVAGDKPVTDPERIGNLFAYNASDDIKLAAMFQHKAFKAQYQLKKGLLDSYPDIIYKKDKKTGKTEVRINRMKIDDTSAKFAQRVLCPDGHLDDIRAVSFEYPKGSGRNVLKETREWAEEKFRHCPQVMRDHLGPIFDWYGAIEGHNFDDSEHYQEKYFSDGLPAIKISDIPMPRTTVPYFNADGTPSSTYANFGIGGIHGAEYDQEKYNRDVRENFDQCRDIYEKLLDVCPSLPVLADKEDMARAFADTGAYQDTFPDDIWEQLSRLKPTIVLDGGEKLKRSSFVTIRKDGSARIKWPKPVNLFVQDKKSGKWNLNKKYAKTSDDEVDHQDFTSYYPCMLMNLKAYENAALGEDRYVQQFNNKGSYGKIMKDKNRPESERDFYAVLREGTKLILNSASGASDTAYDNPIRMNNVIISMRLIG